MEEATPSLGGGFGLQASVLDFVAAEVIDRDAGPTLRPTIAPLAVPSPEPIHHEEEIEGETATNEPSEAAAPHQEPLFPSSPPLSPAPAAHQHQHVTPGSVKVSIGPQHFDLLKLIGEGAFGRVILVRNRLNKRLYAMKAISKSLLRKKNNMTYMQSERDILTKISHPFIVTLWFAFQSEARLFLVMDFLAGGELFFHLKRKGLILEHEARLYLAEMVLAVEFLHSMGVVHRDLKPENVLLHRSGHVCLTDFGLAKEVGDSSKVRTLCGTSEYMAPEMLLRNGYTKAVDWWSLGALFFEMLTGKPPFTAKSSKELDRKIMSDKPCIPSYITAPAASLLKGMLEKDVNKRLGSVKSTMFAIGGVVSLKAHVFFSDLDWQLVLTCHYPPPIAPFPAGEGVEMDTAAVSACVLCACVCLRVLSWLCSYHLGDTCTHITPCYFCSVQASHPPPIHHHGQTLTYISTLSHTPKQPAGALKLPRRLHRPVPLP